MWTSLGAKGLRRQSAGKERRSTSDIAECSFPADHRSYTLILQIYGVYGRSKGMGKYFFRWGYTTRLGGCLQDFGQETCLVGWLRQQTAFRKENFSA